MGAPFFLFERTSNPRIRHNVVRVADCRPTHMRADVLWLRDRAVIGRLHPTPSRDRLMPPTPRVLAFAGSQRAGSFNRQLVQIAAEGARLAGAELTLINLADYSLPLFDQDLEASAGPPENAVRLKKLFIEHQGLLIASPEYNSSVTALLKNTIDWISRSTPGEPALAAFQGKVASLLSASPGALGGLRGLVHLRAILGNIGVVVLPEQIAVPKAHEAFADDGSLKDTALQARVRNVGKVLAETARKLAS